MEKFSATPIPFVPIAGNVFFKDVHCAANAKSDTDLLKTAYRETAAAQKIFSDCEFLSCGRDALFRIAAILKRRVRLWIPSYFCPSVVRKISQNFDLRFFDDFPSEPFPRFETLKAEQGDLVLCVNFFGLRNREDWNCWRNKNPFANIVEDHTHDPFSQWAAQTCAEFSFASLRKFLPLPDGAYLLAKNFPAPKIFRSGGSLAGFAAASLSAQALLNAEARFSKKTEELYYDGEQMLAAKTSASRISKYSLELLDEFDFDKIARRRAENLAAFARALKPSENFRLVGARFCPVVKFADAHICSAAYKKLSDAGVFLSVYWGGFGKSASLALKNEAVTVLCPPLDFRHNVYDAEKIAEIFNSFAK